MVKNENLAVKNISTFSANGKSILVQTGFASLLSGIVELDYRVYRYISQLTSSFLQIQYTVNFRINVVL